MELEGKEFVTYCDWTDRDLVAGIQSGNHDCFVTLFQRYRPLVEKIQRYYYFPDFDRDDVEQECRILLFTSVQRYDAQKGVPFAYFYKRLVTNHFISLVRKSIANKRRANLWSERHDWVAVERFGETHFESPLAHVASDDAAPDEWAMVQEDITQYYQLLSPIERRVLLLLHQGFSYQQLATHLAVEEKVVRNAYSRCRQKMLRQLAVAE